MFNLVVLTGRLTSDPELKTTPSGKNVTNFTIANDAGYGENKKTNFITVVAWQKTAEFVTKYFRKGSMIGIEGEIQTRKYEDKNGNKRMAFEVKANDIQFVDTKKTGNQQQPQEAQGNDDFNDLGGFDGEDLPF